MPCDTIGAREGASMVRKKRTIKVLNHIECAVVRRCSRHGICTKSATSVRDMQTQCAQKDVYAERTTNMRSMRKEANMDENLKV